MSLENLQKLDNIITCIEWDLYILKKKNVIFCFCDHIGRHLGFLARHQLCQLSRQLQKIQTLPNILVYNTSCSMRGVGGGEDPGSQNWSWLSPYQYFSTVQIWQIIDTTFDRMRHFIKCIRFWRTSVELHWILSNYFEFCRITSNFVETVCTAYAFVCE